MRVFCASLLTLEAVGLSPPPHPPPPPPRLWMPLLQISWTRWRSNASPPAPFQVLSWTWSWRMDARQAATNNPANIAAHEYFCVFWGSRDLLFFAQPGPVCFLFFSRRRRCRPWPICCGRILLPGRIKWINDCHSSSRSNVGSSQRKLTVKLAPRTVSAHRDAYSSACPRCTSSNRRTKK